MEPSKRRFAKRKPFEHETPLWVRESKEIFLITLCCQDREKNTLATNDIGPPLLETVRHRNREGIWWCSAFVIMPDHVHGLIQFSGEAGMRETIRNWKSWTTRALGIQWQRDWFDHRLRGEESWREKAAYLESNPVRAGLVNEASEWPYFFFANRK